MHNNNEYNRDADISATVLNLFIIAIIMQNIEIILIAVFINYICFYVARERYCEEYCNYKIYYFIKRSNEKLHEAVAVPCTNKKGSKRRRLGKSVVAEARRA